MAHGLLFLHVVVHYIDYIDVYYLDHCNVSGWHYCCTKLMWGLAPPCFTMFGMVGISYACWVLDNILYIWTIYGVVCTINFAFAYVSFPAVDTELVTFGESVAWY